MEFIEEKNEWTEISGIVNEQILMTIIIEAFNYSLFDDRMSNIQPFKSNYILLFTFNLINYRIENFLTITGC